MPPRGGGGGGGGGGGVGGGGGGGGGGGRRQSARNISPLGAATRDNAALQAQVAESKRCTDAQALEEAAREVESSRGVVQENAALKAQLADLQQVDSAESPFKALVCAVLTPEEVVTLQASCIGRGGCCHERRAGRWHAAWRGLGRRWRRWRRRRRRLRRRW